jgi:hypothetical protein
LLADVEAQVGSVRGTDLGAFEPDEFAKEQGNFRNENKGYWTTQVLAVKKATTSC